MKKKTSRKPTGYKKLNGSSWIRKEKRLAIYLRDNFRCTYCKRNLKDARRHDINLDHLICRGLKGSTNDPSNLVTACRSCNSSRQDLRVEAFATKAAMNRIAKQIRIPLNIELAKALIEGRTGKFDR